MRILLLPLLGLLALQAEDRPLVLVTRSASDCEIVCAPSSTASARLAANELQAFLRQATGTELPLVDVPTPGRPHVFVGPNPTSEQAGVSDRDLEPEGFHEAVIGGDLHLVGRDTPGDPSRLQLRAPVQSGTLSAVYDFLERHLGVMFCWDEALGTVVPRHESLSVPAFRVTQHPAWDYRCLAYGPRRAPEALYGRRIRLGWTRTLDHSHAWFELLPAFKYGYEHPEYFALVKGERVTRYYNGRHGGQLCTSNPEVVSIVAQSAIQFFKMHPDQGMFSIAPNDGVGFCECGACRAQDAGTLHDWKGTRPQLTDRMLKFYNAVAEQVAKACPDKRLGGMLYEDYRRPPQRERRIHPNLFLMYVANRGYRQGQLWTEEQAELRQWQALGHRLSAYDIFYEGPRFLDLMAPATAQAAERLRGYHAAGLRGGYLYTGQSYEQLGAGHYLLARLMWDPKADAADLERRYYRALYGPAAEDVAAYYRLLEQGLKRAFLGQADVKEPVVARLSPASDDITPGRVIAAYWPLLAEAERRMVRAEGQTLSPEERQRLGRLRDHHDLLVGTVRGLVAWGRGPNLQALKPSDLAMLKAAVALRESAKARLQGYAPTLCEGLRQLDLAVTACLLPKNVPGALDATPAP